MTQPPNQQPGWWQPPNPPPPAPPAQPGQYGPPGQYGAGFQSQYGGFGAFGAQPSTPPGGKGRRSKRPLLITALAVVVLAGGVVTAWLLGAFRGMAGDVIEPNSLENGVLAVLRESYGEQDVRNPRCPVDQPARNGTTFECTVDVAGEQKTVSIRVLNDKPEVEVGMPR
ncbi:DUF4333 domain-containing protein [Amycolatopsis cihanbeyliensis]|uniref:Uncharacterized protein DUF4333 n=1 Tax=Amycolatopsis cihanbeyliensis TaxID=1128664 RepID=A0A542DJF4_AMYCI|nr:DUF4333 domain-containing protein [Amycolatopsis cihanbeyliensis]TQJ03144.1 uncharacterized protein DUF4333 [Amycolatopsis cihanbeyliensis]